MKASDWGNFTGAWRQLHEAYPRPVGGQSAEFKKKRSEFLDGLMIAYQNNGVKLEKRWFNDKNLCAKAKKEYGEQKKENAANFTSSSQSTVSSHPTSIYFSEPDVSTMREPETDVEDPLNNPAYAEEIDETIITVEKEDNIPALDESFLLITAVEEEHNIPPHDESYNLVTAIEDNFNIGNGTNAAVDPVKNVKAIGIIDRGQFLPTNDPPALPEDFNDKEEYLKWKKAIMRNANTELDYKNSKMKLKAVENEVRAKKLQEKLNKLA